MSTAELLVEGLDTVFYSCPERLWPDVAEGYRASQVLLVSAVTEQAWLWNDRNANTVEPTLTPVAFSSLDAEWLNRVNFGVYNNFLTLGLAFNNLAVAPGSTVEDTADASLLFHEGFHFAVDQLSWNLPNVPIRTGIIANDDWRKRYYREELINSIYAYIREEGDLGAVAYWNSQYEIADAAAVLSDYVSLFDIFDGSANYVATRSLSLAKLGCQASDEALVQDMIDRINPEVFGISDFPSDESHILGEVAGVALAKNMQNGWQTAIMENSESLVDVLIGSVDPVVQPENPEIAMAWQTGVEEVNMLIDERLLNIRTAFDNPAEHYFVAVPLIAPGAFGGGEFIHFNLPAFNAFDNDLLLNDLLLALMGPEFEVFVSEDQAIEVDRSPCGGFAHLVLVFNQGELSIEQGALESLRETVSFENVTATAAASNDRWLCTNILPQQ